MKILFVLLLTLICMHAKNYYDNELRYESNEDLWYERYTDKLANGQFISSNFGVKYNYKNGKQDGDQYFYYSSGKTSNISNFTNGIQIGDKGYYESGNLRSITTYKDGKQDIEKRFYESGNLEGTIQFKNNQKETVTQFYESGETLAKFNFNFKNGNEIYGETYYKNGNIKCKFKINYTNGNVTIDDYYGNTDLKYKIILEKGNIVEAYKYNDKNKIKINEAQVHNYIQSKEWSKGE